LKRGVHRPANCRRTMWVKRVRIDRGKARYQETTGAGQLPLKRSLPD